MIGVEVRYRKMREKIETYQQLVSLATLLGNTFFSLTLPPLGGRGQCNPHRYTCLRCDLTGENSWSKRCDFSWIYFADILVNFFFFGCRPATQKFMSNTLLWYLVWYLFGKDWVEHNGEEIIKIRPSLTDGRLKLSWCTDDIIRLHLAISGAADYMK